MRSSHATAPLRPARHGLFTPPAGLDGAAAGRRPARSGTRRLFVPAWAGAWAAVGLSVGAAIGFTRGGAGLAPILGSSVLFAEVVGFTALVSARAIFPHLDDLRCCARVLLQIFTLFSGTVFGSGLVIAAQPLFSLAQPRTVALVVLVNAVLGTIVGISLHTYDSMRRQLRRSFRALQSQEAMERELKIAREVQRELLPHCLPSIRSLQLAGVCVPSTGVGGDFYDFLPLSGDRVGLVIADVSGKGIPAALLMAGLQASVRSFAEPSLSPREVNLRLNRMLCRSTADSRYATLFFGLYDGARRTLTYSNAGHYPPIHIGRDRATRLSQGGMPIGLLDDASYREESRELAPGDLLLLCTDGIIEARGEAGEEFGDRRILEILCRNSQRNLEDLLQMVLDRLAWWRSGRPVGDDLTLVLARAN